MGGRWKLCNGLAYLLLICFLHMPSYADAGVIPFEEALQANWKLQSGCLVKAAGEQIASGGFDPQGWIPALVPGTVLGSQVEDGLFPNPFFGMNLRTIPGTDYPIGKIFGYQAMSKSSPYRCSWWYRTEFAAGPGNPRMAEQRTLLHFDGINYRANIWLNGKQIATSDQIAGAFRSYDLDVSDLVEHGHANVLAVEVFAQTEKDLGIDFLDWNPAPADKSMGLWRGVSVRTTGPVTIANPSVSTHFVNDELKSADLRVSVDVVNHAKHPLNANVEVELGSAHVERKITLGALGSTVVHFEPEAFPQLHWKNPQVWWPYQYGEPHLETMRVRATVDHVESDAKSIRFGIREVNATLNAHGFRQFEINHRDILIRGAGWTPDLFYREPTERLREELTLVKEMHLNSIRLEGKMGSEAMFNLADEMGILVLAGWQCCDYWQSWNKWKPEDRQIAVASTYSQISRLRSHASVIVWLNGSDEAPVPEVEKEFLNVLAERDWPNPVLSSAADRTSDVTGKSGVKMSGPYDYVPPEYWYLDKDKVGGAFGFNMETSPGPAIPSVATIEKTLPKDSWWPIDEQWKYHAGLGKFAQYNNFTNAMTATYGKAASLDDYVLKAQMMAYDGERAMFEAYGANKYQSTGVIQWMLNNAWPSFIWHLYDYDLVAGGGYFGTRKANEPLHIQYRYDDRRVVVVNSTLQEYEGLKVVVQVLALDGRILSTQDVESQVAADGVATVVKVPAQNATTFLRLVLRDGKGDVLSENFYWVPSELAQLDWGKSTYVNTPANHYADMRDLNTMEAAHVAVSAHWGLQRDEARVDVENGKTGIAFFMHVRAVRPGTDEEIPLALWSDNFVSLAPGEKRVLTIHGLPEGGKDVEFKLDGWNVARNAVTLRGPQR